MKNYILILVLCLMSLSSFSAESGPVSSPDFNYQVQKHPNLEKEINNFLVSNDVFFTDRELSQINLPANFAETKSSLSMVNRIYAGDLGNTVVLLKAGVIPSNLLVMQAPVQIENGFLQHFKQASGLVVAVFVITPEWDNAAEIFSGFKENTTSSSNHKKSSFELIDSVYADDCANCGAGGNKHSESGQLGSIESKLSKESSPIQHLTSCTMSALKGVWSGSGGAVASVGKSVGEFIMSPIESGKKFWESTTKLWGVTKRFLADFENQARQLYSAFDALDPLMKTKLTCEVIGTVGGGVLLSYLSAGVMASSATAAILTQIKQALITALKLTKFANAKKIMAVRSAKIIKVEKDIKKNLFDIKRGTPEVSLKKNTEVLTKLDDMPLKAIDSRKAGFTDNEIQKLFREVNDHPVASMNKIDSYSKLHPGMGFCFGRATTAHIKALTNGIDKTSVRKVWALGELETGSTTWRYHVTTIVRDSKGKWQAIDPIFGKPMPVTKWYDEMKKFDSKGDMRIFDTEAKRFGPDVTSKYNRNHLNHPDYENYFDDLMENFRKESHGLALERRAAREN